MQRTIARRSAALVVGLALVGVACGSSKSTTATVTTTKAAGTTAAATATTKAAGTTVAGAATGGILLEDQALWPANPAGRGGS